jgi:hypothetical protein
VLTLIPGIFALVLAVNLVVVLLLGRPGNRFDDEETELTRKTSAKRWGRDR